MSDRVSSDTMTRYGNVPKCPACDKSVYPVEQVQISIIYNIYTSTISRYFYNSPGLRRGQKSVPQKLHPVPGAGLQVSSGDGDVIFRSISIVDSRYLYLR